MTRRPLIGSAFLPTTRSGTARADLLDVKLANDESAASALGRHPSKKMIRSTLTACGLVLAFMTTLGCASSSERVVEEPLTEGTTTERENTKAPDSTSTHTPNPVGETPTGTREATDAKAGSHDDENAAACSKKTTREDCTRCCDLKSEGGDDPAACAAKAKCEDKSAPDDCRTQGCAADESCQKCWGGWTCMRSGTTC